MKFANIVILASVLVLLHSAYWMMIYRKYKLDMQRQGITGILGELSSGDQQMIYITLLEILIGFGGVVLGSILRYTQFLPIEKKATKESSDPLGFRMFSKGRGCVYNSNGTSRFPTVQEAAKKNSALRSLIM